MEDIGKKLMIQKVTNFSEDLQFMVIEYETEIIDWKKFEDKLVNSFENFRKFVVNIYKPGR